MSRFNVGWLGRRGAARVHLLRIVALLAVLAGAGLTLFLLSRDVSSAERACRRGQALLDQRRTPQAAEQFERAIELDPRLEAAWRGLLDATPTASVCYRFACQFPELFDGQQPADDPALLVSRRGRVASTWQRSLQVYEQAVSALAPDTGDSQAAVLRLDFLGRQELGGAWAQLREVRVWLEDSPQPLSLREMRPFARLDFEGAQRTLVKASGQFSDRKKWGEMVTQVGAAARRWKEGIAHLTAAAEKDSSFVPSQLTLAYAELGQGTPAAAEARCQKLLSDKERGIAGEERIRYCLARALEVTGRSEEAARQIERISQLRPDDAGPLFRLWTVYVELGRVEEADAIASRLAVGEGFDRTASYVRGIASLRRGDYAAAADEIGSGLEDRFFDPQGHYHLARAQAGLGQHDLASREYLRVAERVADPGWPLAAAAACFLAGGQHEAAAEIARQILSDEEILKRHPELRDYALRFQIAAAAVKAGPALKGLNLPEMARSCRNPELAYYLIAGIWAGQQYVAADVTVPVAEDQFAFFRAAQEPSARYCLAFLLAAAGRLPEARTVLEELNRAHPDHVLAALHLARLLLIDGKTERAARVLEGTGLARRSMAVARGLALIDSVQGLKVPREILNPNPDFDGDGDPVGPHLAFSDNVVYANHRAFAQRLLVLDPVSELPAEILRLTYAEILARGLDGVTAAAAADSGLDLAIRMGLASQEAARNGFYRLAIGQFWREIPPHL